MFFQEYEDYIETHKDDTEIEFMEYCVRDVFSAFYDLSMQRNSYPKRRLYYELGA